MPACRACGGAEGRLRVCTKQVLCPTCRQAPEHRLMTAAAVRRQLALPEADFFHLRAGTVPNPVDPRYRRVNVYYWKDVAAFCAAHGLELPE